MTNVSQLKPETLSTKFGRDETLLKKCAEWHVARAQQQINWAKHHHATGYGTLSSKEAELDLEPLENMQEAQEYLAIMKPRTVQGARELLEICRTILSHPADEHGERHVFSEGPVVEIIGNVLGSLGWMSPTDRLVPIKQDDNPHT
jgi:hypothetical protein